MTPLLSHIIARIQKEGPLSFADFMETALYDAQGGYYGSGKARLGSRGDFYTAVSVGPLFGTLLARQFAEMWQKLGRPREWTLVEQGAFDGQLALDVLSALQKFAPDCFDSTTLRLVEPLSLMRERQMETLSAFAPRVEWHEHPETLPSFCGVHYSNELLDAFPVHRLRMSAEGWREMRVATDGASLGWIETAVESDEVRGLAARLCPRESGAFAEVCPGYGALLNTVGSKLARGWLLALDYGMSDVELALPIRREGTVSAYRNHQRQEDLLANPGDQDLTAQVNFSIFAGIALETGWSLEGFVEQHRFFTGLAPLHFRDATAPLTQEEQRALLAFRTLTHPQLMGFQFKAACLGRGLDTAHASETPPFGEKGDRLSGLSLGRSPEETLFPRDVLAPLEREPETR